MELPILKTQKNLRPLIEFPFILILPHTESEQPLYCIRCKHPAFISPSLRRGIQYHIIVVNLSFITNFHLSLPRLNSGSPKQPEKIFRIKLFYRYICLCFHFRSS